MIDYKNHPDANKPVVTDTGYKGKRHSIKAIVKRANYIGVPVPDFMWTALNNRYVRMVRVWKERYARQRQHALQLQNTLTEKNAYIRELQDEIETLKTPDFFAK